MSSLNTTSTTNDIVIATNASLNPSLGPTSSQTQSDVSEAVLSYFVAYVAPTVDFLLVSFGVSTSVVNIIVYWGQGIGESANITFISLSSFNLIACFITLVNQILNAIDIIALTETLLIISTNTRYFAFVQVTLITVYLSLERCICIKLPLKVRDVFTHRRVILINVFIAIFGFVCYIPIWATPRIQYLYNRSSNLTQSVSHVDMVSVALFGIALPALAQIVIAVCTGIMLHGINQSLKFRQRCATIRASERRLNRNEEHYSATATAKSVKRIKIMTRKDLKLTKVVVLLAIKNCIFNLPVIVGSFLRAWIPGLGVTKQYYTLFEMFHSLSFECRIINCVTDIFVYYNASSNYRKQFRVLCSRSGFVKKR